MIFYSDAGVRELLREACKSIGGQRRFARLHNLSASYTNKVIHGVQPPGRSILKALKLKKFHHYEVQS